METERMETVALRLPTKVAEAVEAERERLAALVPGVKVTRTDAILSLLERALRQAA